MAQNEERQQQKTQQQPQQPKIVPDPHVDPIGYAQAHGYKPLGIPTWPNCLWIDTNKPQFEKWERVPKMTEFQEMSPDGKSVIIKMKQVQQRVGNVAGHISEHPVFQTRYTPRQQPVLLQDALLEIMEREHRKQIEAEKAAREAEKAKVA